VDRPAARNAMTPAMYFGVRYAINLVESDADLAGLLITGTGDVFMPGGDLSGNNDDGWADLPRLLFMDNTPFVDHLIDVALTNWPTSGGSRSWAETCWVSPCATLARRARHDPPRPVLARLQFAWLADEPPTRHEQAHKSGIRRLARNRR